MKQKQKVTQQGSSRVEEHGMKDLRAYWVRLYRSLKASCGVLCCTLCHAEGEVPARRGFLRRPTLDVRELRRLGHPPPR